MVEGNDCRDQTSHDHGDWEANYREEVPALYDPNQNRFISLAEENGQLLGYVGWNISNVGSGRIEMVAVQEDARGRGVATALCTSALARLKDKGVSVVHIGTGGDEFHADARRLYESLGFTGLPTVDYTKEL